MSSWNRRRRFFPSLPIRYGDVGLTSSSPWNEKLPDIDAVDFRRDANVVSIADVLPVADGSLD